MCRFKMQNVTIRFVIETMKCYQDLMTLLQILYV